MPWAQASVTDRLPVSRSVIVPQLGDPGDHPTEIAEDLSYRGSPSSAVRDVFRSQTKSGGRLLDQLRECPLVVRDDSELTEDGCAARLDELLRCSDRQSRISFYGALNTGDLLAEVRHVARLDRLLNLPKRWRNSQTIVCREDRPPRYLAHLANLPAVWAEVLVVQRHKLPKFSLIRTHNRVDRLGQEAQELLVVVHEIEPRVVEDPIVIPVVVVHSVLPDVARRVLEPSVRAW